MKETWSELFLIAAAQFNLLNDEATSKFCDIETNSGQIDEIKNLREIITKFSQEQIDPVEYSCLRSVILLKSSMYKIGTIPNTLL